MKKYIMALAMLSLAGCSTIDQNKLIGGISEPQQLDGRKITVCDGNYFEVGWDCARLNDAPAWLHPIFAQYFGCAVNWTLDGKIIETVIISSNFIAKRHEVEHARGKSDASEKFETDPAKIRAKTELSRQIIASYGDQCQPYTE